MKRNEDSLRDLWDNIKCTNIHIIGAPTGEEREKGLRKIFEEIQLKTSLTWGGQPSPGSTENPSQDKPKEEHTKTSNQTYKN